MFVFLIIVSLLFLFFSCKKGTVLKAEANLVGTDGAPVGKVMLYEEPGSMKGVMLKVTINKLPPGVHAIHIHEFGKAEPPDFKSSGGHFNPFNKEHGFKNPKGHHAGDLENITVGADGKANVTLYDKDVTLEKGKPNSLFKEGGTSIVIHEKADDYMTNPSGNSGARIAAGVVTEVMSDNMKSSSSMSSESNMKKDSNMKSKSSSSKKSM